MFFCVEQSSNDLSISRPNTPIVLNSTEISADDTREMISISSIASPEPQIVTIGDDSNEPTMPYGFGRQFPIVPPSLNDLNMPPNPFHILNTMAVVTQTHDDKDGYSPQSSEPSDPSPISTPPMNVSTFNSWETPHTTTDDNTFYRRMSHDVYTGPLPRMKHLSLKTCPDKNTYCPVPHRRHHLREGRKES